MRNRTVLAAACAVLAAAASFAGAGQPPPSPNGWQIPENAREEKSPLQPSPEVLKKGKSLYDGKCAKCHGPQGKGDGPDGDKQHPPADLTDASRAERNPDGIMFYKVWNGRKDPKMPAFKSELTRDEVWTVVEYVKSLRQG
jgi:mono/diheme cytochrome c family protein